MKFPPFFTHRVYWKASNRLRTKTLLASCHGSVLRTRRPLWCTLTESPSSMFFFSPFYALRTLQLVWISTLILVIWDRNIGWLALEVLHPGNISSHTRTSTDLGHDDFIVFPHWVLSISWLFYDLSTSKIILGLVLTCESAFSWRLYNAAPGDQVTSTMTWDPTQSHYPESDSTSPCLF